MSKKVMVTGVRGQVGSYMIEYLLSNTDFNIIATTRRVSNPNNINISNFLNHDRVIFDNLDLNDPESINQAIIKHKPDYFLNFGANAFVPDSWNSPSGTMITNTNSIIHILDSVRKHQPLCRVYNACSSEIFGNVLETPQNEDTRPNPRSIYGVSKNAAKDVVRVYRDSYDLYAVSGILFNNESPRRAEHYVTRKITKHLAKIYNGITNEPLKLGNMDARRDWTDSRDMVRGIWMMMNQDKPKDYVLASGKTRTVREFVDATIKAIGIKGALTWQGWGLNKQLVKADEDNNLSVLVEVDPKFFRPAEVDLLLGDASKAKDELGWEPEISFETMVNDMVQKDLLIS